jgi:hypothetical protein
LLLLLLLLLFLLLLLPTLLQLLQSHVTCHYRRHHALPNATRGQAPLTSHIARQHIAARAALSSTSSSHLHLHIGVALTFANDVAQLAAISPEKFCPGTRHAAKEKRRGEMKLGGKTRAQATTAPVMRCKGSGLTLGLDARLQGPCNNPQERHGNHAWRSK